MFRSSPCPENRDRYSEKLCVAGGLRSSSTDRPNSRRLLRHSDYFDAAGPQLTPPGSVLVVLTKSGA